MKNRKLFLLFLILFILLVVAGYFGINYVKNKKEQESIQDYVPEQEITDEQYRQTIVSLFFVDKESKELLPEARMVDIKEIMDNPYEKLIDMLIQGPKNEKFEKVMPENTKLLGVEKEGDTLKLNFSKEILNYDKTSDFSKSNLIYSIVNTLTELTEINHIKILVEGEENSDFADTYVRK